MKEMGNCGMKGILKVVRIKEMKRCRLTDGRQRECNYELYFMPSQYDGAHRN